MTRTAQLLISAALCGVGAVAQTTPAGVQTLMLEGTLPFNQIGITGDANIPANVVASVNAGALEVRQLVELVSGNRLRIRHILVQRGAPNPTPAGTQNAVIEDYFVRIDSTIRGTDPASVTYIGTIDQLNADSPLALRTGRTVIYSVGWQGTGTARTMNNSALIIPGRMATWAQTTMGTLMLSGESSGTPGGGTGSQAPVVNIVGGPRIVTSQPEMFLDASGSTDPGNTALTYSWRVVRGAANLINPTSPTPRVQFGGNADEYVFEVTVTNAAGTETKQTIAVFYTGRF